MAGKLIYFPDKKEPFNINQESELSILIKSNFNIDLDVNSDIPTAQLNIYPTVCSCNKIIYKEPKMEIIKELILDKSGLADESCSICRNLKKEICIDCELNHTTDCPVIKSLGCTHNFHLHCISKWLKQHDICPLCLHDWIWSNNNNQEDHITIYFDNQTIILNNPNLDDIYKNLKIDNPKKYIIVDKHKKIISENNKFIKSQQYAVCSADCHGENSIEIKLEHNNQTKSFYLKLNSSSKDLHLESCNIFDLIPTEWQLQINNINLISDFKNMNLYNLGLSLNNYVIKFVKNILKYDIIYFNGENIYYSLDKTPPNSLAIFYPMCNQLAEDFQSMFSIGLLGNLFYQFKIISQYLVIYLVYMFS